MLSPYEPTLDELIADPLIRTLMRADGLDPRQVAATLRSAAIAVESRRARPSYRKGKAQREDEGGMAPPRAADRELCGCAAAW